MKITYRREMKHNYLIVNPESLIWRNYECRMLAANSIEGVLHFQIRQVDDEIRFFYEITSRQPLERMLESRGLQAKELRSLMFGISRVLDRMEQYLLREGSVLLEPDYIYVEPETYRVWLCLVPGLERDFREDYGKLLEYLLGKADHQDKDSVVLAYGLYQETRRDNYSMEDILRLLRAGQTAPELESESEEAREPGQKRAQESWETEPWQQSKPKVTVEQRSEPESDKPARRSNRGQKYPIEKRENVEIPKEKEKKSAGPWRRLCIWWNRHKDKSEPDIVEVPWEMMFHEDAGEDRQIPQAALQEDISPGQDTVLLADLGGEKRQELCRLRALDGDLEDILISYYPFVIGKQENLVDYLLDNDTVSRLHMRIDRDGDQYFVQDLNSTNGTIVAGHLLENNESVQIHDGEEVHIARCRFCFEKG